jgi:hypothetical protein
MFRRKRTKVLRFDVGDFASLRINPDKKGMITEIFPCSSRFDYKFEWWDYVTGRPARLLVSEFEIERLTSKERPKGKARRKGD